MDLASVCETSREKVLKNWLLIFIELEGECSELEKDFPTRQINQSLSIGWIWGEWNYCFNLSFE
jgi:hypothetical protein